jgi:uncharacterized Rossmann fold enzyme
MKWNEWKNYYEEILRDFNFNREEDERSALILSQLLEDKELMSLEDLTDIMKDNDVYVFGCSPDLEEEIENETFEGTLIAANGATTILLKKGIIPDIIVTDLDGKIDDQIYANEKGAIVVIHAHGDNIDAVKNWVPRFNGKVVGTTQSKPFGKIHNFGGFTDGDRCVFLADEFKAKNIYLIGFDFEHVGDKFSNERSKKIKRRKLDWAYILINSLDNPNIIMRSHR